MFAEALLPTRFRSFAGSLFGAQRPEPSYPVLPLVDGGGQSSVPGLYLAGEVAGTPLVKLGLNQGVEVLERVQAELAGRPADENEEALLDVLIVGAGAAGLGAAMRAHELGMRYVLLESERMAMTVVNMYKGKLLFAEPDDVKSRSSLWFEECTREELLARWRAQVEEVGLALKEHEKVTDIRRRGDAFDVQTVKGSYRARRIILATGKAGNPRKAGVPGEVEHAHKIHHRLTDPDEHKGQHILVYGGGDVACEAVIALAAHNQVTHVMLDEELSYPKKRNADAVRALAEDHTIELRYQTKLVGIDEGSASFALPDGETRTVDNDVVFEMIGAELPLGFLRRIGVKLEGTWQWQRWAGLAGMFLAVYSLYALKKFPDEPYSWPFSRLLDVQGFAAVTVAAFDVAFLPFRWAFSAQAYADMRATLWFQQGYLYSLLYTVLMIAFGLQALKRWSRVARNPRYQRWRYASLLSFQVVFFLVANVIAVQGLSIQHSWRAWGLYQPWPLFFNTFSWWDKSDPRAVLFGFVGAGLVGTFVAIPWASHKHGKRFCTWICGCGGLAETLGDRWRHLAPKGAKSRAWEFQGAVVLAAAAIVTVITIGAFSTRADNSWALAYSYVVDFWLVAVIPIALYPFFGGKIWCRYWCPLAAWNQILARWYGRLRIKSNDKCISCTQCSRYCQVGVDVMAFAKNQEAFDNRNSACIHCGICIDVCPMDVLSFDAGLRAPMARSLPVVS
jgi:NosR/NirI family transcriptional regulator, nitrous oxide reductase regulator